MVAFPFFVINNHEKQVLMIIAILVKSACKHAIFLVIRVKKYRKPHKIKVSGGLRFAAVVAKQMSPGHLATCQESMRQDSNLRPLRPERSALPS